ncbi:galactose-1-phosphate uridylyltransferase, partial [Mycobacterium tuberculosis]
PGVAQVFCFENRGEEIGVTLPTRTARFTPIRI